MGRKYNIDTNGAANADVTANVVPFKGEEPPDDNDKKQEEKPKMVGFLELFRFSDVWDRVMMVVGTIAAMGNGAALPLMIIVFGNMADSFINEAQAKNIWKQLDAQFNLTGRGITEDIVAKNPDILRPIFDMYNLTSEFNNTIANVQEDILQKMGTYSIYYVALGCAVLVLGYIQVACWVSASHRQCHRIRTRFFGSIMRQDIGWFDTHESGELNTRLTDDINKIQEGIGDKVSMFVQWFSSFVAGFAIGFAYGWKLTLVILAVSPLLIASGVAIGLFGSSLTSMELKAYAKAGAVAEEVLGSIRTVMSFGGQKKELDRYSANLAVAKVYGVRKSLLGGVGIGIIFFIIYSVYALAFWYGAKLTRDEPENYTPGKMIVVFMCVLIGAFSIGNSAPNIQSIATARGAAYAVYDIIDRVPPIDSSDDGGVKPDSIQGNIAFENVHFRYPSRPDAPVLEGLSLNVNVGQTVALVGSSGCGKSTTVQLLQRFYDVGQGRVLLDGRDIRDLNVRWLRERLGVVSQEPVLFGLTIAENIRYGRLDVTDAEIEQAAREANAYNFIMELPQKFQTMVGERGAQLSGGQKQRVAIARALVRDPKILLLDEATSALDTESESIVQAALDKARMGRTTIVIAHRLSTITTADVIVGIKEGIAVEQGTHEQLMEKHGIYFNLVTSQTRIEAVDEEETKKDLEGREFARMTSVDLQRVGSVNTDRKRTLSVGSETGGKVEEDEKLPDPSLRRIMRLNSSEWPSILIGCIASIINGAMQPLFAILFAEIIGVFGELDQAEQERRVAFYCGMFVVIGAVSFFAFFFQGYMFGKSGETLTERMRHLTFNAFMRQDASYFDDQKNNTGSLCTRLATDASAVQGATGTRLGMLFQSFSNILTAVVVAFIFGWKLTLMILAFLPIVAIAGYLQMRELSGHASRDKEALEAAGKVALEGIENMRTVANLTREPTFYEKYMHLLAGPYKIALKKTHVYGITSGFSNSIVFFAYAASFSFGAYLIREREMEMVDVFRVFSAIVFSAMALGQANSFAPDYGKAKVSAARIFALLDRVPDIDNMSEEGQSLNNFTGEISFKEAQFLYPSRPNVLVLQGLNICVRPGQRLALVGSSGCGKSTTIQLIERFYDPIHGQVTFDDQDVRSLNLQWLRSQIGIVSQEPVLFDASIAENIAYGDNSRHVTMDEIIAAARSANIHDFIQSLPAGYETNVGDKGTQLSGGQKQRVAIARALIRNPKVLLLDEATSALDTESEKIVQEALDRAQEGRTCIVIAHRLSTIQNADCIAVMRHGQVIEQGTHAQLMQLKGFYCKLNTAQQRR